MEKNSDEKERPVFRGKQISGNIHGKNFDHKEIKLEDGKYKVIIQDKPFKFEVLRNNKPCSNLTGDKLVYVLCQRILELEKQWKIDLE